VIARKPITVIAVSALSIKFYLIKGRRRSASRSTFPSELERRLPGKILHPLPEPAVELVAIFPLRRSEIKLVLAGATQSRAGQVVVSLVGRRQVPWDQVPTTRPNI
jgi:hypothetical protein